MKLCRKLEVIGFALLLVMGTGVSLYTRMSNEVKATVSLGDYPLIIEHSLHETSDWTTGPLVFDDIHRLDNLIIDMQIKTQDTATVQANLIIQIDSDIGFIIDSDYQYLDFDRLFLAGPDINLMDHVGAYSTNHTLFFEIPITVDSEGFYPWLDMTFSENASGSYEISIYAGYLDF